MSIRFANNVKTVLLLGALMGLVVAVGAALGQQFIIPFFVLGVLMNVGAWFFSDTIAIRAMQGRELTRENGGWLYAMVEDLARRADLPMPRVYLCPHTAPNAFATGRSPSKAAVAFTQGALDLLTREELEGVAAHELAHIKNRDTLTSCIAATVAGVLAMLAQMGFFLFMGNRNGNPLVMLVVVIIGAVGAALIKAMISRSREFVADADGARIAGSPHGLMSALRKLEHYGRRVPLRQPNPAQNNLFIVEPLTGGKSLMDMFATHPPTEARLRALAQRS